MLIMLPSDGSCTHCFMGKTVYEESENGITCETLKPDPDCYWCEGTDIDPGYCLEEFVIETDTVSIRLVCSDKPNHEGNHEYNPRSSNGGHGRWKNEAV